MAQQPAKHGRDHCFDGADPMPCLGGQIAYLERTTDLSVTSDVYTRALQSADTSGTNDATIFTIDATNGWVDLLAEGWYEIFFGGQWTAPVNLTNHAWIWAMRENQFVHPVTEPPVAGYNAVQAKPAFNDDPDRHFNVYAVVPVPLLRVSSTLREPPIRVYAALFVIGGNRTMDESAMLIRYRPGWPL